MRTLLAEKGTLPFNLPDFQYEMSFQRAVSDVFMFAVNALIGNIFGQIVHKMSVVVQDRCGNHQLIFTRFGGKARRLQHVLLHGDLLAVVLVTMTVK